MSRNRIKAIILQELYITKRNLSAIMDLFFFSVMSTIVMGFISIFISSTINPTVAIYLFLGTIFWEIIRINQYSISLSALWNIWSRNLSNMFVTPLSIKEYFIAEILSAIIKSILVFLMISAIALLIFHFNIFRLGPYILILAFLNLAIFAWSVGITILGYIFRYGERIASLAWSLVFLFQPLTAAFFPVKILPSFLQKIAFLFPPTYVFEVARNNLSGNSNYSNFMLQAFLLNIVYFILSLLLFNYLFARSKDSGQFARNET